MCVCVCVCEKQADVHDTAISSYFSFTNIKEDVLKNVGNQTVLVPIDFHYIFCPYLRSQWEPKLLDCQHIFFLGST